VEIAKAYIVQLDAAHAFDAAIVTTIEPDRPFYPAEAYHQDFLTRHPGNAYIVVNDLPKLDALRRIFPGFYRADPVLVAAGSLSN
jgi:peptide-methionine (S)-S-oxide reductase